MESHTLEMAGSSATPASSRWNPTKEQINMLENLYKQGIRTPSAEQIRQITARLRAYSDIEGKNVFYWFQNHKSRQRLKQKQESIAYFSRFLHSCHPIFSSSICPNVPQRELGFYPQYSMVILTGGLRESPITEKVVPKNCDGLQVNEHTQQRIPENFSKSNQGTLTLFPLHPTGILEGKTMKQASNSLSSLSADTPATSESSDIDEEDDRPETQSFDFFSLELGFRESD